LTDQPGADAGAAGAPSIEDTLSKAFDEIEARGNEAGEADTADTGDEAGDTAAEVADTDTSTEQGEETTDQGTAEGDGAAEKPLSAPERWSAEQKSEFTGLPRNAQEILLKREADVTGYLTQETQKLAEIKREYEPVDRIIGPRKQAWAMSGFTPDGALTHLFALSDFATKDKPGFVRWFAQQHGIDLAELSAGGHEAVDPKYQALEQRVQSFEQLEHQRQQQASQQHRQTVQAAITEFAADTKANPHFKDVEGDIAVILPGIRQANPGASHKELLRIAYDKAVWANDGTRAKLQADEQRMKALEAANAAKKAKAAGGANVKTSGSLSDGRSKRTMDDTMNETYDRIQSRA
jgi:hypothetical protein